MNTIVQFVVLLIAMGSLQGLFLSFILVKNTKHHRYSNLYLALFILGFSLSNLHYIAHILNIINKYNWLNFLSFPWTFLIPIAFYFFILYLLEPSRQISKKERWLFIPFIIQLLFHLFLLLNDLIDFKFSAETLSKIKFIDLKVETILSLLLNLIFIPLVLKRLSSYESKLKKNYSEISSSSVAWLKRLVQVLIIIWIIWALPALYQVITGITTPILDLILWCLMSASIYWIGYATYFRRDIFFAEHSFPTEFHLHENAPKIELNKDEETFNDESDISKPTAHSEAPQIISKHYNKMIEIIEREKLYTDAAFNLSMLSDKCQLSSNYLSQIINKMTGDNFYMLINKYRVNEAKYMLRSKDYTHYNLLSIGIEAGFKSKSSFYKIFKEHTSETPGQFQKNNPST